MFGSGLGVGVRVLSEGFNVFSQYVVRIETVIRGCCLEGILSGGDFVWRGFCPRRFCPEGILFGGDCVLDSSRTPQRSQPPSIFLLTLHTDIALHLWSHLVHSTNDK